MTHGRNSTPVAFRLPDELYLKILVRAQARGITPSEWCKRLVLRESTREHKRKEVNNNATTT